MKSRTQILLWFLLFSLSECTVYAQAFQKAMNPSEFGGNFSVLSKKIDRFYDTATGPNRSGYKQWKRFEWFAAHHLDETGNLIDYPKRNIEEWSKFKQSQATNNNALNSPTGNWSNIGHSFTFGSFQAKQGRVNCVAFDPVNGNIVYVGSAGGGIWKTFNGGSSWINLSIDLPILGISDIAVAPAPNNNIVYALTGEGLTANIYLHKGVGVIKSYDGGITWERTGLVTALSQQTGGHKLLVHPNNANYVIAAMSSGLFRTMDGGASWTNLGTTQNITDVEFKPNDLNIIYYTVNNSNVFTALNLTTLGSTTTTIAATQTVTRMEIAVSPSNGNAVYVLAGPGYRVGLLNLFNGLFYSNNSGQTFNLRSNSSNGDLFNSASDISWYTNAIYVDPGNENNVIAGGLNLFSSTDGGITLNQITANDIHSDQHEIRRNPANGNLWLCNDGGVYKSTNGGTTWSNTSNGLIITEYYRISGTQNANDIVIGGAQDNGHMIRDISQSYYTHVLSGDGMDNYFNSSNNNLVYASTQNGGLNASNNGGTVFFPTTLPNSGNANFYPWITPIIQHPPALFPPINTEVIYVYGFNGVMRSIDGGTNWTNIGPAALGFAGGPAPSMGIGSQDFGFTTSLYVCNGNSIWVSTDPLATNPSWINRTLPISPTTFISAIAVNPANRNEIWAAITGYQSNVKIFRSLNAGQSWSNLSLSLPNTPIYSIAFARNNNNPGGAVYIGTETGVFYTDDNLPDWVPFSNGLPHVPVTDLHMNYFNNTLKAATYGRGIWQTDLYQNCPPLVIINYDIWQGQYNFESSGVIEASRNISGGLGTRVTMKAASRISLKDGFSINNGSYLRIISGNCGSGVISKADSTGNKPK